MADQEPQEARQGPRPLPLYLTTAMIGWTSSLAGLPLARSGSPFWNPRLRSESEALARDLARIPHDRLAAAVTAEITERSSRFLSAVERYRQHPAGRRPTPGRVAWTQGGSRLLDIGPVDGIPLLVVPSLINRWHILDLTPGRSFVGRLAEQGVRSFVMDWGAPGPEERGFTLTDYVTERLDAALSAARAAAGAPVALLGYCMGGLLATALALRRQEEVPALAAVATPWDFHAAGREGAQLAQRALAMLEPLIAAQGELPVDAIQSLFHSLDPFQVVEKFLRFESMDPASARAALFVAVEDWVNDGVPLAGPVARECLDGWYGRSEPARGAWRIGGRSVRPEEWRRPFLAVLPARDRIVPPASAAALAVAIPRAERMEASGGHIGMIVGEAASPVVQRIATWLRSAAATGDSE